MNKIANVRSAAAPTVEELVARARELKPLLSKNGPAGESDRRVVEESIEAARKAGLFKVCTPKRYGGWEMNTRAMLDVSSAVAEADGGTAWVVNLNNICCWLASLFPVKAQDEVFADDPDVRISGVLNPTATTTKVDGGYRVTGQWHYNSGGWHSQWAVLGLPIVDAAGEPIDQGLAMFPMSDLERVDTWFVAGMKSRAAFR
jgi:alkylation response protein AidB-like acyl-CoA dehydrogenase